MKDPEFQSMLRDYMTEMQDPKQRAVRVANRLDTYRAVGRVWTMLDRGSERLACCADDQDSHLYVSSSQRLIHLSSGEGYPCVCVCARARDGRFVFVSLFSKGGIPHLLFERSRMIAAKASVALSRINDRVQIHQELRERERKKKRALIRLFWGATLCVFVCCICVCVLCFCSNVVWRSRASLVSPPPTRKQVCVRPTLFSVHVVMISCNLLSTFFSVKLRFVCHVVF